MCKLLDSSFNLVKTLYSNMATEVLVQYYLHPVSKNVLVTESYTISSTVYNTSRISGLYLATNILDTTFSKTGKLIKSFASTDSVYNTYGVYNKDQLTTYILTSHKKSDGNYYLDIWKVTDADLNSFTSVISLEQNNTIYNITSIHYMSNS